jgi:hypothetical protein
MLVYLHADERYNITYNRFTSPTLWVSTASLRTHALSLQETEIKVDFIFTALKSRAAALVSYGRRCQAIGLAAGLNWLYALLQYEA